MGSGNREDTNAEMERVAERATKSMFGEAGKGLLDDARELEHALVEVESRNWLGRLKL